MRGALALVKTPDLGAVSAYFHVAPAAAVVAAGIQEKPLAAFRLAGTDTVQVRRSQQIKSGAKNWPQNAVAGSFILIVGDPLPFEAGVSAPQVKVFGYPAPFAANFIQMVSRGILLLYDCGKTAVQCFADLTDTLQDFFCGGRVVRMPMCQPAEKLFRKRPGLSQKREQISERSEQFLFALWVTTIVQGVDEVEAKIARNELEFAFRHRDSITCK